MAKTIEKYKFPTKEHMEGAKNNLVQELVPGFMVILLLGVELHL
jgi:hypothetical protein